MQKSSQTGTGGQNHDGVAVHGLENRFHTGWHGWRCAMSAAAAILPQVWASIPQLERNAAPEQKQEQKRNRTRIVRPELAFYRKYTEGMLRRYVSMSLESGRVPSLLGKEMFRGKVTSYQVHGFDDVVIFIHDMEKCISRLGPDQQRLVRRIAVQQFTLQEVASLVGNTRKTVLQQYNEAINRLTGILLAVRLLEPFVDYRNSCQEEEGVA